MRVVVDTNVLLSAAFFPGVCEKLLAHCFLTPSVQVVLSEHILGEFVEHGLGKLNGTDDLPVLGAAIAAHADCLITGDKELLNLGSFHSIAILSPRAFYDRLRVD